MNAISRKTMSQDSNKLVIKAIADLEDVAGKWNKTMGSHIMDCVSLAKL